jgi:hypothetical protein
MFDADELPQFTKYRSLLITEKELGVATSISSMAPGTKVWQNVPRRGSSSITLNQTRETYCTRALARYRIIGEQYKIVLRVKYVIFNYSSSSQAVLENETEVVFSILQRLRNPPFLAMPRDNEQNT